MAIHVFGAPLFIKHWTLYSIKSFFPDLCQRWRAYFWPGHGLVEEKRGRNLHINWGWAYIAPFQPFGPFVLAHGFPLHIKCLLDPLLHRSFFPVLRQRWKALLLGMGMAWLKRKGGRGLQINCGWAYITPCGPFVLAHGVPLHIKCPLDPILHRSLLFRTPPKMDSLLLVWAWLGWRRMLGGGGSSYHLGHTAPLGPFISANGVPLHIKCPLGPTLGKTPPCTPPEIDSLLKSLGEGLVAGGPRRDPPMGRGLRP